MGMQEVRDDNELPQPEHVESQREIAVPFPLYTYIILACIGAVFLTQILTSQDPDFLLVDRYSAYYAGFDKKEFLNGEYWRIFTGAVIHSGIPHVLMNSYALYQLGRLVELLSNRAHVAIVFILSALGGGVLSLLLNPSVPSVGASGGIIGLLSYLAVYAFKRRRFISAQFRKSLLINIGFILVFGLVLYNVVDNFGHLGGLIVGALYGLVQIPSDEYVDPRVASTPTRVLGVASLGVYIITAALAILLLVNGK